MLLPQVPVCPHQVCQTSALTPLMRSGSSGATSQALAEAQKRDTVPGVSAALLLPGASPAILQHPLVTTLHCAGKVHADAAVVPADVLPRQALEAQAPGNLNLTKATSCRAGEVDADAAVVPADVLSRNALEPQAPGTLNLNKRRVLSCRRGGRGCGGDASGRAGAGGAGTGEPKP